MHTSFTCILVLLFEHLLSFVLRNSHLMQLASIPLAFELGLKPKLIRPSTFVHSSLTYCLGLTSSPFFPLFPFFPCTPSWMPLRVISFQLRCLVVIEL